MGLLRSRLWDKDLSSRRLFENWSWETWGWIYGVKQDGKAVHDGWVTGTVTTRDNWSSILLGVLGDGKQTSSSPTDWRRELRYLSITGYLHSSIKSINKFFLSSINYCIRKFYNLYLVLFLTHVFAVIFYVSTCFQRILISCQSIFMMAALKPFSDNSNIWII